MERTATDRQGVTPVRDLIADGRLRTVFQPITAMAGRRIVGYEALTRGPAGTELEGATALFAAARAEGCVTELDVACQADAIRVALAAGMSRPLSLFLNTELSRRRMESPREDELTPFREAAEAELPIVFELTERGLVDDPAGLIMSANLARTAGWAIALDDLGADPRALALLPVVAPDVIKLDMELVQSGADSRAADVVHAVAAELEHTHTPVIAEGVERGAQLEHAHALGATHAQGYLYGAPGELGELPPPEQQVGVLPGEHFARPPQEETETFFDHLERKVATRVAPESTLEVLTRRLEDQARGLGETGLMISNFQEIQRFDEANASRYAAFATHLGFVGALGAGFPDRPAPGVRGGSFPADSPRRKIRCTVVISPHFAGVIAGREIDAEGRGGERRFRFGISHDRTTAAACARSLLGLIEPVPG